MILPLPPASLRMNSATERDDDNYLRSAANLLRAINHVIALGSFARDRPTKLDLQDMAILDFGCGTCRLLHGLDAVDKLPKGYVGIDVQDPQIAWARETIVPLGNYRFQRIDAQNDRYNPLGRASSYGQIADEHLGADLVVARSVLTHMKPREARETLRELRRAVSDSGRVYLTVNVSQNGPRWADLRKKEPGGGKLLKTEFRKAVFERMLDRCGFAVAAFVASVENQCVYLLSPK